MIIGICGKARSGKDSVADHLCRSFGFQKRSFATPLKELVGHLFDMNYEQLYGELKEQVDTRYGKSPRWFLQYLGTDVFRALHPTIWTDLLIRDYHKAKRLFDRSIEKDLNENSFYAAFEQDFWPPFPQWVVPDVRFQSEIDAIRSVNGLVWKTVRKDHQGASGGIPDHPSETSLDGLADSNFDAVLEAASGQLEVLYKQADALAQAAVVQQLDSFMKGNGQ